MVPNVPEILASKDLPATVAGVALAIESALVARSCPRIPTSVCLSWPPRLPGEREALWA